MPDLKALEAVVFHVHVDHLAFPLLSLTNQITEPSRLLNQSDYQIAEPIRLTKTPILSISVIIYELPLSPSHVFSFVARPKMGSYS